jgi:NAD(P)-dependent dehydrogenase (short-subunit alcohol dehydrogenase family)
VLNMGSGAAHFPSVGLSAYCASKAALNMLTQCWQLESSTIAFASVMPGIVETHMQGLLRDTTSIDPDQHAFYNRLKQTGRLVSPETVASFLCWLLLDVPVDKLVSKEWDIYNKDHHHFWLKPPQTVPTWG